jgi:hypothetical protein
MARRDHELIDYTLEWSRIHICYNNHIFNLQEAPGSKHEENSRQEAFGYKHQT